MFKVEILDQGKFFVLEPTQSLFEVLQQKGLLTEAYCGGKGLCGKCLIQIIEGEVSPPTSFESRHLGEDKIRQGFRLACQIQLQSSVKVRIPHEDTFSLQTAFYGYHQGLIRDLPLRKKRVVVRKPELAEGLSLQEVLEKQLGDSVSVPEWDINYLRVLGSIGSEEAKSFEVLYGREKIWHIAESSQGESGGFLGVAFDLGTTTLACELVDLESGTSLYRGAALNRQASFGADVLSRIEAIQRHPDNLVALQKAAISTMNQLIQEATEKAGRNFRDIFVVSVAGNTVMEHIFWGVSPVSIGVAPYVPVFVRSSVGLGEELGLLVHPKAQVYLFPSCAGYVGGDIVSGLTAFEIEESEETTLYVDIGTNGEIVLVHDGKIWCCGTAAGPAFEGAQIRQGMRATPGAVSSVSFRGGDLIWQTVGGEPPRGICGTGLIDALAMLLENGLLSPTGRLLEAASHPLSERIEEEGGEKVFVLSREPRLVITQKDISQLQLAKAALQAGRTILLKEAGLREEDIQRVVLAGSFGSFINSHSAVKIGLIPPAKRIESVGNACLAGAKEALLSERFRKRCEELARKAQYIELSGRSDFQDVFTHALFFENREYEQFTRLSGNL
ncbi:ASKHA domain-containing protein [Atrimonas thermophila]|uniref:ASKHA domain-containing protein n=1 Tax=Atrimonas thermophila TaxID=3064161 RepID=UPI00399C5DA3